MKGNDKVIAALNQALHEELTALSQYFVHAEMRENWKYINLAKYTKKLSIVEMKHAEKLIEHILFLEGTPDMKGPAHFAIGKTVQKQFENDLKSELDAIKSYNDAVILAGEVKDFATREILEKILKDEDRHIDQIEELQDQISQMSLQIFLTTQVG